MEGEKGRAHRLPPSVFKSTLRRLLAAPRRQYLSIPSRPRAERVMGSLKSTLPPGCIPSSFSNSPSFFFLVASYNVRIFSSRKIKNQNQKKKQDTHTHTQTNEKYKRSALLCFCSPQEEEEEKEEEEKYVFWCFFSGQMTLLSSVSS